EDDWKLWSMRLHAGDELGARHPGHDDIRHDGVDLRSFAAQLMPRVQPVDRLNRIVSGLAQHPHGQFSHGAFVVYDEDGGHKRLCWVGWFNPSGEQPGPPGGGGVLPSRLATKGPAAAKRKRGLTLH